MEKNKNLCHISKKDFSANDLYKGSSLKKSLFELIRNDYPDFAEDSYISTEELNKYRRKYLEQLIESESGELTNLEKEVLESISKNELLSSNIEPNIEEELTPGQRYADKIADFGGSWTFIIFFFLFILGWMITNIILLQQKPFDPYPFILLNLILSCLAALQAPIIMMSQNRKDDKDRKRSEFDYKVNLKAELEIRLLHEKIDLIMTHQNQKLIQIQELQTDYLEDILNEVRKK